MVSGFKGAGAGVTNDAVEAGKEVDAVLPAAGILNPLKVGAEVAGAAAGGPKLKLAAAVVVVAADTAVGCNPKFSCG